MQTTSRTIRIALAGFTALAALAGSGGAALAEGKNILWVQPMRDHPVHRLMQAGFLAKCKELGNTCEVVGNPSATNYDVSASIPPEKLDAAVRFIGYLTQPEVASLYLAPEQPIAASIKGVPQIEDAYAVELRKEAFPATIKFLDWIWPSEVSTATASAIAGVVGGTTTPEAAAQSIQAVFDDLKAQGQWPPK